MSINFLLQRNICRDKINVLENWKIALILNIIMYHVCFIESDSVGYHVNLRHGTSVCRHHMTRLESGLVTADLTSTVVYSFKSLTNAVKSVHSP